MSQIITRQLDCGLTLVAEPIRNVASVALDWLLPVGSADDPAGADGQSALLSELIFRGAGGLTSREHSDALDRLGVQRSSQTLTDHLRIDATLLGDRLEAAIPLIAMLVREPALPAEAVDAVRSLCLQSLDGLEDDPQHLAMLRLRALHAPSPFGRSGYGERQVLEAATADELRDAWRTRCVPGRSILAVAGAVEPDALAAAAERVVGDWHGTSVEPAETGPAPRGYRHYEQDTAQVHLAMAYDAPREPHEHSMLERLAISVLSGSTSGRLFTEVRQKRSLCYSVGASYRAGRDRGLVALYAGTTPERAQETLEVCGAEIRRLFGNGDGVSRAEFDRAVIGLKSHLIMQGESTPARAAALGHDHYRLARARSLEEVAREIDGITPAMLDDYVSRRSLGPFTVVSIGAAELDVSSLTAAEPPAVGVTPSSE